MKKDDQTFRIEITESYDCCDQLHKHLAEAKKLDVDVDISRILEGGVFVFPHLDSYHVINRLDFFTTIYDACEKANYDPSRIIVWWGNANAKELYQIWCEETKPANLFKGVYYFPVWLYLIYTNIDKASEHINIDPEVTRSKLFTFFVGFNREHRINAINFLYNNNLLDKCDWTWVNSEKDGLPLELYNQIPKSAEGHKHFNEKSTRENPGKEFFMLYENNYFDLITETYYYNDFTQYDEFEQWYPVFFSEKIWRSIMNKRPFLLIGNKGSLKELHNLGFKTFPTMFDESYDLMGNDERIYHVLNQLKNLTPEQVHNQVYSREVIEAVEHNFNQIEHVLYEKNNVNDRFHALWSAGNFCVVKSLPYL